MNGANEMKEVTAEDIEQRLMEEANAKVQDPVGTAAMLYGLYLPKFKEGISQLSSRARARVLNALIEYPLNEKKYAHRSALEKELMAVGHAVLEAKFLMIMATYNSSMEELIEAAKTEDLTEEQMEELNNFFNTENINIPKKGEV